MHFYCLLFLFLYFLFALVIQKVFIDLYENVLLPLLSLYFVSIPNNR